MSQTKPVCRSQIKPPNATNLKIGEFVLSGCDLEDVYQVRGNYGNRPNPTTLYWVCRLSDVPQGEPHEF